MGDENGLHWSLKLSEKIWPYEMFWNFLSHSNEITRNYHDRCIIKFKSRFEGWKMFSNQNFHQIEI